MPFGVSSDANVMGGGLSGLGDIDFSSPMPGANSAEDTSAAAQEAEPGPSVPKSRYEEVKEINAKREKAQNEQEAAREKHRQRLEQWVGTPMKNHLRVLLCTLPDVLWEGHGLERVGMDKMMDP